jgi:hypothetical protein
MNMREPTRMIVAKTVMLEVDPAVSRVALGAIFFPFVASSQCPML